MYNEALEIHNKDCHGERNACTPEDIRHDQCDKCMLGIRQNVGYDGASGGCDNGSDDWK